MGVRIKIGTLLQATSVIVTLIILGDACAGLFLSTRVNKDESIIVPTTLFPDDVTAPADVLVDPVAAITAVDGIWKYCPKTSVFITRNPMGLIRIICIVSFDAVTA